MAKKVLKNRTQITSTLKNELNDKLKQLSEETDVPISKLLDQAVDLLLIKKGKTSEDDEMYIIDVKTTDK